jgi:hypothetical protein
VYIILAGAEYINDTFQTFHNIGQTGKHTVPHQDFIPKTDVDFLSWLQQLARGAAEIGEALGITPEDLATLQGDCADYDACLHEASAASAAAKAATSRKKEARRAIEKRARSFAKRVKGHRSYAQSAYGIQLGIDASGAHAISVGTQEAAQEQPKLRGRRLSHGQAEIKFTKRKAEAVNIYSKREGDADFVLLARVSYSPFVDKRPLLSPTKPERREYIALYVSHDQEYGQRSGIINVICAD